MIAMSWQLIWQQWAQHALKQTLISDACAVSTCLGRWP